MSEDDLAATLVEAENRWLAALTDRDEAALDALLAPGFSIITYLGSEPVGRDRYLRNAAVAFDIKGQLRFELLSVRVVGDVAIVQGRVHQRASVQGHRLPEIVLGTDIWIRADGRWQVIARHASTPAPPR
jgi:ketosteroid isomerase-like protein